jgi:hypothetical protein
MCDDSWERRRKGQGIKRKTNRRFFKRQRKLFRDISIKNAMLTKFSSRKEQINKPGNGSTQMLTE